MIRTKWNCKQYVWGLIDKNAIWQSTLKPRNQRMSVRWKPGGNYQRVAGGDKVTKWSLKCWIFLSEFNYVNLSVATSEMCLIPTNKVCFYSLYIYLLVYHSCCNGLWFKAVYIHVIYNSSLFSHHRWKSTKGVINTNKTNCVSFTWASSGYRKWTTLKDNYIV